MLCYPCSRVPSLSSIASRGLWPWIWPPSPPASPRGQSEKGATPCTDGRPSENTPPWLGLHQSSLPNAAKGYPPREPPHPPSGRMSGQRPRLGFSCREIKKENRLDSRVSMEAHTRTTTS